MAEHDGFLDVVKDAIRAEGDNWAGRTNLIGMVALFLLMGTVGVIFDAIGVVGRWFKDDYDTGYPSLTSLMRTYGYLLLACVAILGLSEVLRAFAPRRDTK